jgi:hypothetical protein
MMAIKKNRALQSKNPATPYIPPPHGKHISLQIGYGNVAEKLAEFQSSAIIPNFLLFFVV